MSGWDLIERLVGWRARYELAETRGLSVEQADRVLDDRVIELPAQVVDAALAADVGPSPYGRQPTIYDEAS
jgi:hypothetical protein